MEEYQLRYDELVKEYENYQNFAEKQIQKLSNRNMKLERDINALSNIVEISKYINSFLNDENLISMINDMIVGLLGVVNSTIYLRDNLDLIVKSTSLSKEVLNLTKEESCYIEEGKSYLINSRKTIRSYDKYSLKIKSVMGMPVKIRGKYIGFIIVEHHLYNFLDLEHEKFLRAICNQIAIGIENSILYMELQETAKMDPLLGIYNRRHFFNMVSKKEKENPDNIYAIVMLDLDNFKKINDNFGHQFGDKVLTESTRVIKNMLDDDDIIARYGGEEIIIYINKVEDVKNVYEKIEAIRMCLEKNIVTMDNLSKSITASFGVACFIRDGSDINEVIRVADKCLYQSKSLGKNRVLMQNFPL